MTLRIADAVLNAGADAAVDLIDSGAGANGTVQFYSGSPPASISGTPAGTLLATVDFSNPAFGNAGATTAGEADVNGTPTGTGLADGTIGFARVRDADNSVLWDEDDVNDAGDPAILVNSTTVEDGGTVEITGYTWVQS